MKNLIFIAVLSVSGLVNASNIVMNTTALKPLPTPKDIKKYVESEYSTNSLLISNGPGDDDVIIVPPKND